MHSAQHFVLAVHLACPRAAAAGGRGVAGRHTAVDKFHVPREVGPSGEATDSAGACGHGAEVLLAGGGGAGTGAWLRGRWAGRETSTR